MSILDTLKLLQTHPLWLVFAIYVVLFYGQFVMVLKAIVIKDGVLGWNDKITSTSCNIQSHFVSVFTVKGMKKTVLM